MSWGMKTAKNKMRAGEDVMFVAWRENNVVQPVIYFLAHWTPPHRQMAVFGGSEREASTSQRHDVTARHRTTEERIINIHTLSLSFCISNLGHTHVYTDTPEQTSTQKETRHRRITLHMQRQKKLHQTEGGWRGATTASPVKLLFISVAWSSSSSSAGTTRAFCMSL